MSNLQILFISGKAYRFEQHPDGRTELVEVDKLAPFSLPETKGREK